VFNHTFDRKVSKQKSTKMSQPCIVRLCGKTAPCNLGYSSEYTLQEVDKSPSSCEDSSAGLGLHCSMVSLNGEASNSDISRSEGSFGSFGDD
jgi:hypothetical protein